MSTSCMSSMGLQRYPVLQAPVYKSYLWGGCQLKNSWHKTDAPQRAAESWELAIHKNGETSAANGYLAGRPLHEVLDCWPDSLGENAKKFDRFPILLKIIDAQEQLSVQVHPDDDYALAHEGDLGKTECWFVAESDPGASLFFGLKHPLTTKELSRLVQAGKLEEALNKLAVKPGDVFFIKPGTIHSIGRGVRILELQQNSDITYRIYDFNRRDSDGKQRTLHISEALDVSVLSKQNEHIKSPLISLDKSDVSLLAHCNYFTMWRICSKSCRLAASSDSFQALTCISGQGSIIHAGRHYPFIKGNTFFIPAQMGEYELYGDFDGIISTVP